MEQNHSKVVSVNIIFLDLRRKVKLGEGVFVISAVGVQMQVLIKELNLAVKFTRQTSRIAYEALNGSFLLVQGYFDPFNQVLGVFKHRNFPLLVNLEVVPDLDLFLKLYHVFQVNGVKVIAAVNVDVVHVAGQQVVFKRPLLLTRSRRMRRFRSKTFLACKRSMHFAEETVGIRDV